MRRPETVRTSFGTTLDVRRATPRVSDPFQPVRVNARTARRHPGAGIRIPHNAGHFRRHGRGGANARHVSVVDRPGLGEEWATPRKGRAGVRLRPNARPAMPSGGQRGSVRRRRLSAGPTPRRSVSVTFGLQALNAPMGELLHAHQRRAARSTAPRVPWNLVARKERAHNTAQTRWREAGVSRGQRRAWDFVALAVVKEPADSPSRRRDALEPPPTSRRGG